jgi:hypothetical protein
VACSIQIGGNKIKLLTEHERETKEVLLFVEEVL